MDWADLPALLAVSRAGSMAGAAALLGVNATTVSRRLDALQRDTGARLVETDREGTRLTEAGDAVLASVEQMEGLAFEIERKLLGGDARLDGTVRVTTTDTIARYEPTLFSSFKERYPDVDIEVATAYRAHSLSKREADVALRWTNHPAPYLFGRKLVRVAYALYAHCELVARIGKRAALKRYPWLAWDPGSGARLTEQWMNREVPEARIIARYDTALAMHAAVEAGIGVAFMPCAFGDRASGLQRLRGVQTDFSYDIWGLTHPDLAGTARVRAFLQHAAAYFETARSRFAGRKPPSSG